MPLVASGLPQNGLSSSDIAAIGSCRCFLFFLLLAIIGVIAAPRAHLVLPLSELDAAGQTDALEIPLLLSSDVVAADAELGQRPHILWIAVNNSSSTSGQMGMKMVPK
jgi:hypothetical protein